MAEIGKGFDGKDAKGNFSMDKWIENKKASGEWKGSDEPNKQFHKPFEQGKTESVKVEAKAKPGNVMKPSSR